MNCSTTIMLPAYSQRMIHAIDHIGIAVSDLDAAIARYTQLMGFPPDRIEDVPTENVKVAFFQVGAISVELLAATSPESPIAQFIAKRGEGVHHLAYRVADLTAAIAQYQKEGLTIIGGVRPGATPRGGAGGTRVAFLHPKSTHGCLVELVQHDTQK